MSHFMIWLIIAGLCILSEIIVPGAILGFVGVAAGFVALAIHMGWATGWVEEITWFFISSIFTLLILRTLFLRLMPGDSSVDNVDENQDAIGQLVEVVQDISPYKRGRIRFRQSTWDAESEDSIAAGEKAVIVAQSGPYWIVQHISKG